MVSYFAPPAKEPGLAWSAFGGEAGGMEIEEVAAEEPEKIISEIVDPIIGVKPYLARKIAFALNLRGEPLKKAIPFIMNLYECFVKEDLSMLEINPLVITGDDQKAWRSSRNCTSVFWSTAKPAG